MDAPGTPPSPSTFLSTGTSRIVTHKKKTLALPRWIAVLLYLSAALLLVARISGILPHSQTVEYATRINADRARYADGIISSVEALSYQFYINKDLNALLYDFSLSSETYDVSKWNMPFSSFLEGMANTVPELEEALFFDFYNAQKRPLTMTDSITRDIWNAARGAFETEAEQTDGRPIWKVISLPDASEETTARRTPLIACARLVKFVPSGSRIGLLILLLNPERLARAVAGSYWEDMASVPKSDITVLIDNHGIVLSGITTGMIGRPASELVPGFPIGGFDSEKEQGRYYHTQAILDRPSRKYLVLYQRLPEHPWWLCTVLPHAWEGNGVYDYLSPLLLIIAGFLLQWSVRRRFFAIEKALDRSNQNISNTPLTEPEAQRLQALSERERAILSLLATGKSNKEIASKLGLREQTVKNYLYTMYRKLDVQDRVSATRFALRAGMASSSESEQESSPPQSAQT